MPRRWMMRVVVAGLSLGAVGCLIPVSRTATADQTRQASRATASTIASGLRLTLTLARSTYPRNALVQATVQVDNLTNAEVHYASGRSGPQGGCPPPAYLYPIVRAVGTDGTVYPPTLPPDLPESGCLPSFAAWYGPHEQQTYTIPIVLVANRVRATMDVYNTQGTGGTTLLEAEVEVKLTHEAAPKVTVRAGKSSLIATVRAGRALHGPLYYMDRVSCGTGPGDFLIRYHDAWTPHNGKPLRSGYYSPCAPPDHWYLMVGWLNHPVAIVRYHRLQSHSPPTPP